MDTKKSIAVCVTAFLYIMLFAVVGSCFMAFKYEDEKVIVLDPEIVKSEGVKVLSINDTEIDYLDFSEVKLGLKPVTGDLDVVTKIPVTVTDQNGSEGIYAKFKVDSSIKRTLKITNISITGNDKLDIQKERKVPLLRKGEGSSRKWRVYSAVSNRSGISSPDSSCFSVL